MIESFSVRWKVFVNVYVEDGRIFKVEFSKEGVREVDNEIAKDFIRYFRGEKVDFRKYEVILNVPPFVRRVLEFVRDIPYGNVITYGQIAKELKTSPRAIGKALSLNPVPIVIPCHRVVGARDLGGFSYGLWIKRELLKLEGVL